MGSGYLIDSRFLVEEEVGRGAVGTVYRATDRQTGTPVAIKVLTGASRNFPRFEREAEILKDLEHPGIASYIAHGTAQDGAPYLAMAWVDGSSLAQSLRGPGLGLSESLAFVHRVAEILGYAHERGIVHRDIKPSNLFLVDDSPHTPRVLDFGMAQFAAATLALTRTGTILGTPGYMAPEQARGANNVDARADVFSLGCVLFECIAGRRPLEAATPIAMLTKILLEDPPRLSEVVPAVPEGVDELVARMLSKEVGDRPKDGNAVVELLARLGPTGAADLPPPARQRTASVGHSTGERSLLSVVMAGHGSLEVGLTISSEDAAEREEQLATVAARFGARLEGLTDGSVAMTVRGRGEATDLAARAARCALAVAELDPRLSVSLATGAGSVLPEITVGDVIDRAVAQLGATPPGTVCLDDVTSGLLAHRFDVSVTDGGYLLERERKPGNAPGTLLGRQLPFVGRERMQRALSDLVDEAIDERICRIGVVVGDAGIGKSRLSYECIAGLPSERVTIFSVQCDEMRQRIPLGMAARMVAQAAGMFQGAPVDEQRAKLEAMVRARVSEGKVDTVLEGLSELLDILHTPSGHPDRVASPDQAVLRGGRVRAAFLDLLGREAEARPLLLWIEDLHWADAASLRLLEAAVRRQRDLPLIVIATARPEVDAVLPESFGEMESLRLRMGPLSERAMTTLVHAALDNPTEERVVRIVEEARGNPFALEEIIRAVASGRPVTSSASLSAAVQARLGALPPDLRHVACAASVCGPYFWHGCLVRLLGPEVDPGELSRRLTALMEHDIIAESPTTRFRGERQYVFPHLMVHQAAYGLLTVEDRRLGHAVVAEWLDQSEAKEPLIVAEHYELGGMKRRAVPFWLGAARVALDANEFDVALEHVRRGAEAGAEGTRLAELLVVAAESHHHRGDYPALTQAARDARALVPSGSALWCTATLLVLAGLQRLGYMTEVEQLGREVLEVQVPSNPSYLVVTKIRFAVILRYASCLELAETLFSSVAGDPLFEAEEPTDSEIRCWAYIYRALRARAEGHMAAYIEDFTRARALFEELGDVRWSLRALAELGYGYITIGAYSRAEGMFLASMQAADRMNLPKERALAQHNLGLILLHAGELARAEETERAALAWFEGSSDVRMESACRLYLARILHARGKREAAEEEAGRALRLAQEGAASLVSSVKSTLAALRFDQGDMAGAIEEARGALEEPGEEPEVLPHVTLARALFASGREDEAREVVESAYHSLRARADRIRDPDARTSFLKWVPDHAALVAMVGEFERAS